MLLAAALHECGHLALLWHYGVPVEGLRLGASGAAILARGTRRLGYPQELCVTLAGPAVNLLCALAAAAPAVRLCWDWGLLFAGAHALLGAYNLLPIRPLDGGQALYLLLAWFFGPDTAERAATAVSLTAAAALALGGAYLTRRGGGALFLLAALSLLAEAVKTNAPRPILVDKRRKIVHNRHYG